MSTFERDPAKRKVKPVETAQSLLDFDLEESSDDSDFRIEDHAAEDSDDYSINSDDDGRKNDNSQTSEDVSESDLEDDVGNKAVEKKSHSNMSVAELLQLAKRQAEYKLPGNLADILICGGCLGSRSDDSNEIVECDGCGITVHEGCYGVSDVTSESSTVSSASTEPWFCEACKAGVTQPTCELCPNIGGIFKETEVGAWVHLVCALYVPGVAFSEVEKLSGVTLFEMAYSRWGARACALCPDARFARTGVCVGCDAGMCKTYFHVTCGQREGLLAEAHSEEAEQADPFYAHCKLHSDKTLVRKRKRNWLALQLRTQKRKVELEGNPDTVAQLRIQRKLAKYRKKYIAQKEQRNPPWVPTQKMPRLLSTSASACRRLMRKAERMGVDTEALEIQDAQLAALKDVQRRWHVQPAFSVEFIGYYLERNARVLSMRETLKNLTDENESLISEEKELRTEYDKIVLENTEVTTTISTLKQSIGTLYEAINTLCPGKASGDILEDKPLLPPLPSQSKLRLGQPQHRSLSVRPTAAALKMGVGFPLVNNLVARQGKVLSTSLEGASSVPPLMKSSCGICGLGTEPHLLAACDVCHKHYHLGCLRPPLARLPKKSKLYGWQCSECDKTSDSEPEVLEKKLPRRSRTRYSKEGLLVNASSDNQTSPPTSTGGSPPASARKQTKADLKSAKISPLKVTIKPLDLKDNVFTTVPSEPIVSSEGDDTKVTSKRDKKIKKEKKKAESTAATAVDPLSTVPSKKSRKRSFTSPTLTNTPLMSITPIVAESPQESPLHNEASNTSNSNTPMASRIASEANFLSPNSSFSTLLKLSSTELDPTSEQTQVENSIRNLESEIASYKANRKRRKEKHRSRYSPDLMRSPSKSHKHKRKKKTQDIENPEVPHPRITIKIKTIPKPAGSVHPQMFYVPTDSNDGPPPLIVKKHFTKVSENAEDDGPNFSSEDPLADTSVADSTPQSTRPARTGGRRAVGSSPASATPPAPPLTQCDVCAQTGDANNLVRCDECNKRYHFTCLEPPLNKNPKKRGYSWHCADCDPTDAESN